MKGGDFPVLGATLFPIGDALPFGGESHSRRGADRGSLPQGFSADFTSSYYSEASFLVAFFLEVDLLRLDPLVELLLLPLHLLHVRLLLLHQELLLAHHHHLLICAGA
jgi:hypothetical protein